MTEWLSTGRPYGREHCACPADEGSAAGTHPPRSGDTQAVLLTNVSGNRASSRQPPQLPPQGSGTCPAISSKGATENIITPPPLMFRKREGAQQTLWLSYPHPHQCSVLGTCPALATVTGALCPPPAPQARPTPGVSRTQHSSCRSSLPTSEGTPVRGSQPSDPDAAVGRLRSPLLRIHPALPSPSDHLPLLSRPVAFLCEASSVPQF